MSQFSRTELIFGRHALEKLFNSRVAVFGIGGVGGFVVEALARSGVGTLDLFDDDKVALSNLNRQIIATHKTIGRYKVDVAKERILEINPNARVNTYKLFYLPETADQIDLSVYDYVVDAIDTISAKIELIHRCKALGVPIISSMGAGNKINATGFEVADIYETSVCPMAKVLRHELKARKIDSLKVVYSKEKPKVPNISPEMLAAENAARNSSRRQIPGSTSYVPATVGLIIAGEVIKDLTGIR
ncbi:MAG TPA: tRNA threonylcarbamoyladenosine dehydratase [Clostridiales bacterium]|nr:tRNA threonylcarbamoyladenosine dehydratase [Clostridiales bacterium]